MAHPKFVPGRLRAIRLEIEGAELAHAPSPPSPKKLQLIAMLMWCEATALELAGETDPRAGARPLALV